MEVLLPFKVTLTVSTSKSTLSQVCGCCQGDLQRRQVRQEGKRGQICDAMGIVRYGCSGRLAERAIE